MINPLDVELNPICHLLALLGAHHILHVSRIRVNTYLYVWVYNIAILRKHTEISEMSTCGPRGVF